MKSRLQTNIDLQPEQQSAVVLMQKMLTAEEHVPVLGSKVDMPKGPYLVVRDITYKTETLSDRHSVATLVAQIYLGCPDDMSVHEFHQRYRDSHG